MEVLVLTDTRMGSTARILPELGFNCFEFRTNVAGQLIDVIDASPQFASGNDRPSGHGIPLLFPFPNRIRGGRYAWNGRDYEIPLSAASHDGAGNAIHGFCLDRPWRVTCAGRISPSASSSWGRMRRTAGRSGRPISGSRCATRSADRSCGPTFAS